MTTIHYRSGPTRKKPKAGDIRFIGGVKHVRQQMRSEGCFVVRNGRPVWEWVPCEGGEE